MNLLLDVVSRPMAIAWSMVLLHFLWQGCLIAGCVSIALRRVRPTNARLRYIVTCAGLMAVILFPVSTFALVCTHQSEHHSGASLFYDDESLSQPLLSAYQELVSYPIRVSETEAATERPFAADDMTAIEWLRILCFSVWAIMELLLGIRLCISAYLVWSIRRSAQQVSDELRLVASRLAKQLGLQRCPRILQSTQISDAVTCGLISNCVILPTAWLTQMSPDMVKAVLAHELAHVRRYDVWVNFLQRVAETLFFYHPAVWWLSRQIRIEREHSCDADAVDTTGDAATFARSLEFAAQQRVGLQYAFVSSLGEDRMSLLDRVHRVLGAEEANRQTRVGGWPLGVAAILVPLMLTWNLWAQSPPPEVLPSPYYQQDDVEYFPASSEIRVARATPPPPVEPHEGNKVTLPDYVIEPPDILNIESIRLVPKDTFTVSPSDVFQVYVRNALPDAPIAGQYSVDGEGAIQLGKPYGVVHVDGLNIRAAKKKIATHIAKFVESPNITSALLRLGHSAAIQGQFLVGPDGSITLGRYGQCRISGKTLADAKAQIENHLSEFFRDPKVSLEIFAYNSKVYYVVSTSNDGTSDFLSRSPITGNETALDALAQVPGLQQMSNKQVWISRPVGDGGELKKLTVDWAAITEGGSAETNYQLLPGDRLFISDRPAPRPSHATAIATTLHIPIDLAKTTERFNQLVRDRKYGDAIKVARSVKITDENRPVVEALNHHANLLAQTMASLRDEETEQVADLLGELRDARFANAATREALATKIQVKFRKTPLKQVLSRISVAINKDILVDSRLLEWTGLSGDEPISLELKQNISAKNALQLVLDPLQLKYSVRNGIIHVQGEQLVEDTHVAVYYVGDLLGLPVTEWVGARAEEQTEQISFESLKEMITGSVAPNAWSEVGGPCNISKFVGNQSFVVAATPEVHEECQDLFERIRRISKSVK